MSVINSVREYIATYPKLKTSESYSIVLVYVDYSKSDEVTTYSIDAVPCKPILTTYVNGYTENQFLFTLSSVENCGSDIDQNTANIAFFEDFSKWIRENNKIGILPTLEKDQQAISIKALTGGYMMVNSPNGTTAQYIIQCQLRYDQEN